MEAFTPPDYQREDIDYHVRTIDEAIDGAEVAMLAIPNAAVAGFADQYRDRPAGAIIIDPSNPFLWHDDGAMTIKDLGGKSSATVTAKAVSAIVGGTGLLAPTRGDAMVARTVGSRNLGDRIRGRRR